MDLLLGNDIGSFSTIKKLILPIFTNEKYKKLCDITYRSIITTVEIYMPHGMTYFKTHLHVHHAEHRQSSIVKHKYKLKEVCFGINGLHFFAQSTNNSNDTFFQKHFKTMMVQPENKKLDVAVILETWKRRRGLHWQQLILPHMSIFSLSQRRLPEWYNLKKMVAPDNINHFFIQPVEKWQAVAIISEFSKKCYHLNPKTTSKKRSSIRKVVEMDLSSRFSSISSFFQKLFNGHRISSSSLLSPSIALIEQVVKDQKSFISNEFHESKQFQSIKYIEQTRKYRLATYCDMDPFDARSKLKVFNARAMLIPPILYQEGLIAEIFHGIAWCLLISTIWRISLALDTLKEAARTYNVLIKKESVGNKRSSQVTKFIEPELNLNVLNTEKQLRYYLIIAELKGLFMDFLFVWPQENGKIGLGGFWSSVWYTIFAVGFPFLFENLISPFLRDYFGSFYMGKLSMLACIYGFIWVILAFISILTITRNIPGFNDTRRVDRINMRDFPSCLKNYLAILNIIWEFIQLNSIPWQIWKSAYTVKKLAALVTLDLKVFGFRDYNFNLFLIKQRFSFICLVIWLFSLKASNKFKSFGWLNYFITFLLPSFLSSGLFMFLTQEYLYAVACYPTSALNTTTFILWSEDNSLVCWTPQHWEYVRSGMFGMGLFIPLAVLSSGSHQLAFPQLDLDIQCSPLFGMIGQLMKGLMIGTKIFFATNIKLYLGVSITGNIILFCIHFYFPLGCSTWHIRDAKLFIYISSLWSSICALLSIFGDKEDLPLYLMHGGHILILFGIFIKIKFQKKKKQIKKKN